MVINYLVMVEEKYDLAIVELKKRFPEYSEVRFEICDGELSYWVGSYKSGGSIDMVEMQNVINEILGQKKYVAKLCTHESCYARNDEEAREFINRIKPEFTYIDSINEID